MAVAIPIPEFVGVAFAVLLSAGLRMPVIQRWPFLARVFGHHCWKWKWRYASPWSLPSSAGGPLASAACGSWSFISGPDTRFVRSTDCQHGPVVAVWRIFVALCFVLLLASPSCKKRCSWSMWESRLHLANKSTEIELAARSAILMDAEPARRSLMDAEWRRANRPNHLLRFVADWLKQESGGAVSSPCSFNFHPFPQGKALKSVAKIKDLWYMYHYDS